MTDRTDPTRHDTDDWLERALKADALASARAIPDDGFAARVMASLPPQASLPAWRAPAIGMLWGAAACAGAVLMPGALADAARAILHLLAQPFSLSQIGVAIAAMGAVTWSAAAWTLSDEV